MRGCRYLTGGQRKRMRSANQASLSRRLRGAAILYCPGMAGKEGSVTRRKPYHLPSFSASQFLKRRLDGMYSRCDSFSVNKMAFHERQRKFDQTSISVTTESGTRLPVRESPPAWVSPMFVRGAVRRSCMDLSESRNDTV